MEGRSTDNAGKDPISFNVPNRPTEKELVLVWTPLCSVLSPSESAVSKSSGANDPAQHLLGVWASTQCHCKASS